MNKWNKLGMVLFSIPLVTVISWAFYKSFLNSGLMMGVIYPICAILICSIYAYVVVKLINKK